MRKETRRLTSSREIAHVRRGGGRWKDDRRHARMTGKPETTSERFVAVVPLRGFREPGGAFLHRGVLHVVPRALGARTHFAGSMLASQA